MTTSTDLEIVNEALILLGQDPLDSLNGNKRNAVIMRNIFTNVRGSILESYPWSFSTKRRVLTPLSSPPVFGWEYSFQLPGEFLQEQHVQNENGDQVKYRIEGDKLLSNCEKIYLIYTQDETNVGKFSYTFVELLVLKLAYRAAYKITQSRTEEARVKAIYDQAYIEVISNDSQGDGEPRYITSPGEWLADV